MKQPNKPTAAPVTLSPAEQAAKTAKALADRQAKFVELASKRTQKAIDAIAKIGDLSKMKGAYTKEQVNKISDGLNKSFDGYETRFIAALNGGSAKDVFSL